MQGLHFDLFANGKLYSPEFNMFVKERQDFGALVGLQHGLTMTVEECDEASDMILLCPHGSVTLDSDKKVNINISDEGLRYPPYFKYYIRDVLKDIHGSKERNSWIFLALLHLYTSDIIPDPFTKRTGLSRCIEILRSGRCRGNLLCSIDSTKEVFDLEIETLRDIACAIHAREDYWGMEMNNIKETRFESFVLNDGLHFLVHILLNEMSKEMLLIYLSESSECKKKIKQSLSKSGRLHNLTK